MPLVRIQPDAFDLPIHVNTDQVVAVTYQGHGSFSLLMAGGEELFNLSESKMLAVITQLNEKAPGTLVDVTGNDDILYPMLYVSPRHVAYLDKANIVTTVEGKTLDCGLPQEEIAKRLNEPTRVKQRTGSEFTR